MAKLTNPATVDKFKPTSITQFLRGELFIVVDYCLTRRTYDAKEFEETWNFLHGYLKEGAKIIAQCL